MSLARALSLCRITIGAAVIAAAGLAGCANEGGGGGPNGKPLPYGTSCGEIRSELRRLDARGVPSKVEAVNAGRRVSSKDKALADRYNQLLNQYLGARCHT